MIVAALPCPPLGVTGTLEQHGCDVVFTSHGFMMHVLLHTAYKCHTDVRTRHSEVMREAESALFAEIDTLQMPLYPPDAYIAFCRYMRNVLLASPWVHADIRFVPLESICVGDEVHKATCDHTRAHDVLYGDHGHTISYETKDYTWLVARYAYRIRNGACDGC